MYKELIDDIKSFLQNKKVDYEILSNSLSDSLISNVVKIFGFNIQQKYLWEKKIPTIQIPYQIDNEGISFIQEYLIKLEQRIYLCITDDEFMPWGIFFFPREYLIELLTNHRYFEFFIFDKTMNTILFDTHDNEIIIFEK
jgi:hypothetical protein